MKIIVDNKLTYNCKHTVKVGDIVIIPAPWFMESKTTKGKVTQIGSEYNGYTLDVISVETTQLP
jgi:small-conductance mechanosensitive channel